MQKMSFLLLWMTCSSINMLHGAQQPSNTAPVLDPNSQLSARKALVYLKASLKGSVLPDDTINDDELARQESRHMGDEELRVCMPRTNIIKELKMYHITVDFLWGEFCSITRPQAVTNAHPHVNNHNQFDINDWSKRLGYAAVLGIGGSAAMLGGNPLLLFTQAGLIKCMAAPLLVGLVLGKCVDLIRHFDNVEASSKKLHNSMREYQELQLRRNFACYVNEFRNACSSAKFAALANEKRSQDIDETVKTLNTTITSNATKMQGINTSIGVIDCLLQSATTRDDIVKFKRKLVPLLMQPPQSNQEDLERKRETSRDQQFLSRSSTPTAMSSSLPLSPVSPTSSFAQPYSRNVSPTSTPTAIDSSIGVSPAKKRSVKRRKNNQNKKTERPQSPQPFSIAQPSGLQSDSLANAISGTRVKWAVYNKAPSELQSKLCKTCLNTGIETIHIGFMSCREEICSVCKGLRWTEGRERTRDEVLIKRFQRVDKGTNSPGQHQGACDQDDYLKYSS